MKEMGLKIISKANVKVVEFLDVKLDLENETFRPFTKLSDRTKYVNVKSNHPPSILKNISLAVNRRISSISSSKEIFDEEVPRYQTALNNAGYNHKLEYQKPGEKTKRKRYRKSCGSTPLGPPT